MVFSPHTGCENPAGSRARGKHDVINARRLQPSEKCTLPEVGGRRSEKKHHPADIDGFAHGLRSSLMEEEAQYVEPPPANPKAKYKLKARGHNRTL